jgi:hypothetical protein
VLKFRFKASTDPGTQIKKLMTNELNMAVIKIKQQLGIQPTDTAIDDLIADGTYCSMNYASIYLHSHG